MKTTFRTISEPQDIGRMVQLAKEEWGNTMHVIDLPYRLSSWALDDPENVGLWFDEEENLIAWAVMQKPFWNLDLVISSDVYSEISQQVVDWTDARAKRLVHEGEGLPCWFANVFSGQTNEIGLLEANGFLCQADVGEASWSKVWMKRTAEQPIKHYEPRGGCIVRSLSGLEEAQAYVDLHQEVFQSKNMQLEWRLRTLKHLDYRKTFDIVIETPDKKLAAFCIGWLQEGLDGVLRGQIEPLGCHADYRHLGLGRVALSHVIDQLHYAGADEIWVETDKYRNTALALYQFMGFSVMQDVLVYRKDYE